MDYKKWIYLFILSFGLIFSGCGPGVSSPKSTIYYVDILNGDDTVRRGLETQLFGKTSFYLDGRLNLVSKNFITPEYPDYHLYEPISILPASVPQNSKKLTIEFSGNFLVDSTFYAVRLYTYKGKNWVKISDMGFVQLQPRLYSGSPRNKMPYNDLVYTVTEAAVETTYPK